MIYCEKLAVFLRRSRRKPDPRRTSRVYSKISSTSCSYRNWCHA